MVLLLAASRSGGGLCSTSGRGGGASGGSRSGSSVGGGSRSGVIGTHGRRSGDGRDGHVLLVRANGRALGQFDRGEMDRVADFLAGEVDGDRLRDGIGRAGEI